MGFLKGRGDDLGENSEIDSGMAEVEQGEGEELEQGLVEELEWSGPEVVFGKEIGKEQNEGSSTEVEDKKLVGKVRKSWEVET